MDSNPVNVKKFHYFSEFAISETAHKNTLRNAKTRSLTSCVVWCNWREGQIIHLSAGTMRPGFTRAKTMAQSSHLLRYQRGSQFEEIIFCGIAALAGGSAGRRAET